MLARMSSEAFRAVYLLAGSDRPKQRRALDRLRSHFGAEAVEQLSADSVSGADAVAACNALGLFGDEGGGRLVIVHGAERWRKADLEAIAAYLGDPVDGTVLALVAEDLPRGSAVLGVVEKHGQVLRYDVPKRANLHGWVHKELGRLGVSADADAARALVELVGEDTVALAGEMEKLAAWADGEAVTRKEVEQLVAPGREAAAWALTDAWGVRDLPALLEACDLALEKKEPFLLAVSLASHVGRVRAAQVLGEEGLGARDVAARLKIKEFLARKALQHAERYSREELDSALVRLAELDAAIKGASRLSAELELARALIDVTRPAAQAVGPVP
jgi:DNA polymerase-3 subunit delta